MTRLRALMMAIATHFFPQLVKNSAVTPLTWYSPILLSEQERLEIHTMTEAATEAVLGRTPDVEACEVEVETEVWTDASTWGLGGVTCRQGEDTSWRLRSNVATGAGIFLAELAAGVLALLREKEFCDRAAAIWYTDNAAAAQVVVRGHSSVRAADSWLCLLFKRQAWPRGVCLVPSECQRADPLSRGQETPFKKCGHVHSVIACRFGSC